MGSIEQNSPKKVTSEVETALEQSNLGKPPERPTLVSPPQRPVRPTAAAKSDPVAAPRADKAVAKPVKPPVAQSTTSLPPVVEPIQEKVDSEALRYQPIAPPSEPMQYRAIGLVRGTYEPAEADQLNRGNLTTLDGCVIDAVLLGRITSLIKKHIDLSLPHLWVVYPRTRREMDNDAQDLHLQIVGIWEPETLGLPGEVPPETETPETGTPETGTPETETPEAGADSKGTQAEGAEASAAQAEASQPGETREPEQESHTPSLADLPPVNDNFFSIRGEVVKYDPDDESIMVKILQGMKRAPGASKPFKLMLQGTLSGRTVGYFWDFKVKREEKLLVLEEATVVGIVPPKKRPKGSGGMRRGAPPNRRSSERPPMPSRRPMGAQGTPRPRKPQVEDKG